MGQNSCVPCSSEQIQTELQANNFAFEYGEDTHQPKIDHNDDLTSRSSEIEPILFDCQQRLRTTSRLYKDPTMRTDPIMLRSFSGGETSLNCTFERPHIFLNDPSDLSKGKSRKYKVVDYADCKPSQIIIRDEIMQSFGILLCFLADHPHLLHHIILTDTNSYGLCVLRMNVGAKKEYIYIDDYTLCEKRIPLFTQPIRGIYMWPCLLEKGWFKVKGYINHAIEKTSPLEIFKYFLSYPITTYNFIEGDEGYNNKLIETYLARPNSDKGYILSSRTAPIHKIGISGRKYFYLLLSVKFEGHQIFYVRNPCPSFDFRGLYRIIPEELAAILKIQTGEVAIHEGNFVLSDTQFMQQIQSFSVINFSRQSQQITQQSISIAPNEEMYLMMELKTDSSVSVSFIQNNYSQDGLKSLPLLYHLVSISDNSLISDHDNSEISFGIDTSTFFDKTFKLLKPGQYLIRIKKRLGDIKAIKKYDKADKIVVTANSKVKFQYKQQELYEKYFRKFLLQTGKKKLREAKMSNSGERMTYSDIDYEVFWVGDIAVVYFEKNSPTKKQIRVEVRFQKMKNLECITHVLGSDYKALDPIEDNAIMVFEKIELTEAASLGSLSMDTF